MVICLQRGANYLHMVQLISCSSKIQNGLPFWCRLTQVVLEKGVLKLQLLLSGKVTTQLRCHGQLLKTGYVHKLFWITRER